MSTSTGYEVVSKFGVTLATADTKKDAQRDVRFRSSRGVSGLTVVEVERTERRRVVFRARKVAT